MSIETRGLQTAKIDLFEKLNGRKEKIA